MAEVSDTYKEKQNVAALNSTVRHVCIFGIAVILWITKCVAYLALTRFGNGYFVTNFVFVDADCCLHSFGCAVIAVVFFN